MRVALGTGFLAAMSAIAGAIVAPPRPPVTQVVPMTNPVGAAAAQSAATPMTVQRPIQYVQLQPGQTPPPGATVIDAAAPTPLTVVAKVAAPAAPQQPVIIKTTQSGKVIP